MAGPPSEDEMLARAVAGDQSAFAALVEPHRRPLFRHCYQMLGAGLDAEDATQDTLARAWLRLATFESSGAFGGWLHRISTNVCLDALRQRRARLDPTGEGPAVSLSGFRPDMDPDALWVEPVSDIDLDLRGDPGDALVRREDISLAFVAALQRLAPRQRAALLLADVLGFSQAEVAEVLEISQSAVNSLLSRARESARARPANSRFDSEDPAIREFLERYVEAWRLADIDAFVDLVTEDIRFSMPPMTAWFDGRDAVGSFVESVIFAQARPHGVPMRLGWCNGQPACAIYEPAPDGRLLASGLQVLDVDSDVHDPRIRAIVSFRDPGLAVRCGLPASITD